MKRKESLYAESLKNKEIAIEKERIAKEHNINIDNIVISKNKAKKSSRFIRSMSSIFNKLFKILFYIVILVFVTIGATVLMNESLRTEIFSLFNQNLMP